MAQQLSFSFSVEEANVILIALSKLPYEQVASMITNIQQQAAGQLTPTSDEPTVEVVEAENA